MKYNPFQPGKAVDPNLFAGRAEQLSAVDKALSQTRYGNSEHFLAVGERGIGKSSLLDVAAAAARGEQVEGLGQYDFVVVPIGVDGRDDELSIVKKISAKLRTEVGKRKKVEEAFKATWSLVERIEVAGVGLKQKTATQQEIVDPVGDLAQIMANAAASLKDQADGILVLVDEADAAAPALGRVSKSLVDALADERCGNVCMGLAGLPAIVSGLREGHESAPRIFEPVPLEPMSEEECKDIIRKGLAEVEERTGAKVAMDAGALTMMARYSNGYPQFVQQFAKSAYDADTDQHITVDDVVEGMLGSGGAIKTLGTKYFDVPYFELIKSDEYRAVLLAMAAREDDYVTKAEIRSATKLKETTLTNAIHALKERRIIQAHPGKQGEYKLPSRAFALYVRLLGRGREHLRDLDGTE